MANHGYLLEKRLTARHKINFPVKFRLWKSDSPESPGESLDISEGGICFETQAIVEEGQTLEIRFDMPEEVVDEPTTEWRCTGQIVKVDPITPTQKGRHVSIRFDCYEIAMPNGTTTIRLDFSSLHLGSVLP